MKLFVYSYRLFDEREFFERYSDEFGFEMAYCLDAPTLENAHLAEGFDYLSVITTQISAPLVERFSQMGIKMISTRTIGYDHIDIKKAKEINMRISNASYSPSSVADYTIMLMLMVNRKMKRIMERASIQDFSLPGIQGREMHNLTVGIIGTGRIGRKVIESLTGFGCRILAYDWHPKEEVKKFVEYVEFDTLIRNCDMISLHMPATEKFYHMINRETIALMKDKAVIINTARGALIDSEALIEGLECGKLGGAGLDVVEKEFGLYYFDLKSDILDNRQLAILKSFPNVIVTPHMAFYTDQAVGDMVLSSFKACISDGKGEENPYLVSL